MQEKITILIIDDKPANIYALQTLLEKPERVFLNATTGDEGLRIALHEPVDLIILDVQMPEMDGFEVAQILKSNKKTEGIPIIFASAEKKERNSVMKGFEEGAVDYLSKPLDPELTRAKVSVLLQIQLQKKELIEKNLSLERAERQIKQLNENLHRNVQQLEDLNKELESFSYSVSHDLRAPLRSVIGYAKILEESYADKLDEEGKRVLSVVLRNASKMNHLIDDLLQFSRLGKKELVKSEVDTEHVVKSTIADLGNSMPNKAAFKLNDLPPVYADHSLITQVWMNLISNAIKYSSKMDSPAIEIGSKKKENAVVYYIKDNGAGFNMKYADKLFGVFQRFHKPTEFEGTGVGLALVHRIVTRHGGTIWAESAVNEGASFYFSLPNHSTEND